MVSISARTDESRRLTEHLQEWKNGKGALLFLTGEGGMGKSHALERIAAALDESTAIRVDCPPPIGRVNLTAIQPLQPFGRALEQLYLNGEKTAKRRLAMNIGMSLLASLPIAGDIFYAVKAISQDVTEYHRETAASTQKKRAAVIECVETLERISKEQPFVLLIDNGHWCDPQSVEVLKVLERRIAELPLLIVWTVSPREAQRSNLALASFMRESASADNTIHFGPIAEADVAKLLATVHEDLKPTADQVTALYNRSAGSPGIIVEYVNYLQRSDQINADGTIKEDALRESGLKLSDHPATDVMLHEVSDEDSLTLSICAMEGQEFTAFMVSALLNTDVITAVRTLRRLEHETGAIRSIGMRTRYGVKTTTYTFTQNVAYTYFLHYAEYEERKHIHHRIAEILSREQENATVDEIRAQLSAVIAAHAVEAEDDEMADLMMEKAALAALSIGADETASFIRSTYSSSASSTHDSDEQDEGSVGGEGGAAGTAMATVDDVIQEVATALLHGAPERGRQQAMETLRSRETTTRERSILLCLAARCEIELDRIDAAIGILDSAESLPDVGPNERCIALNVRSAIALRQGDTDAADRNLQEAARLAGKGSSTSRLLTLANIVLMHKARGKGDEKRYEDSLLRTLRSRLWTSTVHDLERI